MSVGVAVCLMGYRARARARARRRGTRNRESRAADYEHDSLRRVVLPGIEPATKKGSVMLVTDPGYQSFKDDVTS